MHASRSKARKRKSPARNKQNQLEVRIKTEILDDDVPSQPVIKERRLQSGPSGGEEATMSTKVIEKRPSRVPISRENCAPGGSGIEPSNNSHTSTAEPKIVVNNYFIKSPVFCGDTSGNQFYFDLPMKLFGVKDEKKDDGETDRLLEILKEIQQNSSKVTTMLDVLKQCDAAVIGIGPGCVKLTLRIRSQEGLERLWSMYSSGELERLLKKDLPLDRVNIQERDYQEGCKFFTNSQEHKQKDLDTKDSKVTSPPKKGTESTKPQTQGDDDTKTPSKAATGQLGKGYTKFRRKRPIRQWRQDEPHKPEEVAAEEKTLKQTLAKNLDDVEVAAREYVQSRKATVQLLIDLAAEIQKQHKLANVAKGVALGTALIMAVASFFTFGASLLASSGAFIAVAGVATVLAEFVIAAATLWFKENNAKTVAVQDNLASVQLKTALETVNSTVALLGNPNVFRVEGSAYGLVDVASGMVPRVSLEGANITVISIPQEFDEVISPAIVVKKKAIGEVIEAIHLVAATIKSLSQEDTISCISNIRTKIELQLAI